MLSVIMVCAALTVVDADTVKCDGRKLWLLGEGIVDVRGIDTPSCGRGNVRKSGGWRSSLALG